MSWYLSVLKNYVGFSGRARRKEYWMFILFHCIILSVLYIPFIATREPAMMSLYAIYALATILPGLAVTVRRLHDTGRSGWWYLISLVPFGGIVLLVFECLEGTRGDNQYGTDPKAA